MKSVKPKFKKSSPLLLLILVVFLQSCVDKSGVWKNEKIKPDKREDFHILNRQVFTHLKANDFRQLGFFMSGELLENNTTNRLVELISNRLNDDNYNLVDEYYVINKYRDDDTIKSVGSGNNKYDLYYPGTTREMYFGFFVPKTGQNKYMITIVYSKYNYGWKLSQLEMAPYTINGKTAPELFNFAKEEYAKNYLINAVDAMTLASTCLGPCKMWKYAKEEDISAFYAKIAVEVSKKYKFPLTLTQVSTKPRILRIYTQTIPEGSFPMVYYLSTIKLKDTLAIKKENEAIKKVIDGAVPGIDKDKKYVFYSAFNSKPDGRKTVDHYDITDKLQ